MKDQIFKAENIATALEDAGIPPTEAEEILNDLRQGKWNRATQRMRMQRSRLVADVHVKQNNLYCLDYLLLKIKEAQEANQKTGKEVSL